MGRSSQSNTILPENALWQIVIKKKTSVYEDEDASSTENLKNSFSVVITSVTV